MTLRLCYQQFLINRTKNFAEPNFAKVGSIPGKNIKILSAEREANFSGVSKFFFFLTRRDG
jgi:hypothetical protein